MRLKDIFLLALSNFRERCFLLAMFVSHLSLLSFCDEMHFPDARLSGMPDNDDGRCDGRQIAGINARVVEIKVALPPKI